MLRAFGSGVLRCSTCAGRMQLMATIDDEARFDSSGAR
jgi:muramidase (phage lysozyme)